MTTPGQPSGAQQPPVVGYSPQQLEAAALPLEAATAAALVAVAATAARMITAPAGVPAGVAGAAFVTLDDLAMITGLWVQHTDRQLMPILRNVFHDSAEHVHGQIGKLLAGITELPPGISELPAEPGVIPDVYAEDLMAAARNRLVGIGDVLWANARQQLADGMREGESIPQLAARVRAAAGVSEPRATVIARTEVISTSNGASIAQARSAGVPLEKEWIPTADTRTRATHRIFSKGAPLGIVDPVVPMEEPFIVGGAPLDFPGDPAGPPGEVINCRCSIGFHLASNIITAAARVRKLEGEALAEFNRKHARGPGGRFGSGGTSAVAKAIETVKPRPAIRDVAKARERLANAEKMFGADRSKWKKSDRDLAERFDQFIAQAETDGIIKKAPARKAAGKPLDFNAVTTSTQRNRIKKAVEQAYTGEFGRFKTDKVKATVQAPGHVIVTGRIYEEGRDNPVGAFVRRIRQEGGVVVAVHEVLELDSRIQGQGFAEAFNRQATDWYRGNGVDRIELEANIDVGGYAWARAGYDWKNGDAAASIYERVETLASNPGHYEPGIPPDRRNEQGGLARDLLKRMDPKNFGSDDYPTPFEVSQLGRWPGAGKDDWWAGKAILMDSTWEAVRKL